MQVSLGCRVRCKNKKPKQNRTNGTELKNLTRQLILKGSLNSISRAHERMAEEDTAHSCPLTPTHILWHACECTHTHTLPRNTFLR